MPSALVSMAMLGSMLLVLRPGLLGVSLRGMVRFALLYAITLKLIFVLAPSFVAQWNREALLGLVGGMPVEELLWAAAFGAVWPAMMAYAFDTAPPRRRGAITLWRRLLRTRTGDRRRDPRCGPSPTLP
jgi:hypothetical protein